MISGIYLITNTTNGKIYIGSSNNIEHRWNRHKSHLKNNNHVNIHLQNAWNKYGESSFKWEIIHIIEDDILECEQFYLDTLKPDYNISICATSNFKGLHHTEESKTKISESRKGDKHWFKNKKGKDCHNSLLIDQYTKNGEYIKTWVGSYEIERDLIIDHSNIIRCCKGKCKSAGGFSWRYRQD